MEKDRTIEVVSALESLADCFSNTVKGSESILGIDPSKLLAWANGADLETKSALCNGAWMIFRLLAASLDLNSRGPYSTGASMAAYIIDAAMKQATVNGHDLDHLIRSSLIQTETSGGSRRTENVN
jgi:hypothetical protein